mmetsp:Transcript_10436/g.23670  ORF Transcript_10436/g.23670 Transcript_10436/m.23670 type:complete len:1184 (-) Transcript_10436:214-3765(-)
MEILPLEVDVAKSLERIESCLQDLKSGQARLAESFSSDYAAWKLGRNASPYIAVEKMKHHSGGRSDLGGNAVHDKGTSSADTGEPTTTGSCSAESAAAGSGHLVDDKARGKSESPTLTVTEHPPRTPRLDSRLMETSSLAGSEITCTSSLPDDEFLLESLRVSQAASGGYVAVTLPMNWPSSLQLHETLRKQTPPEQVLAANLSAKRTVCLPTSLPRSPKQLHRLGSNIRQEVETYPWYIIHPDSLLHAAMDVMATLFVLYELLVTPYCVAWNIHSEHWLLILYYCSASFWVLDMASGFVTGFYAEGQPHLKPAQVCRNYMRGWFAIDLFLVLADAANLIATVLGVEGQRHFLRLLRLSRLCRVVSLAKVWRFVMRLEDIFQSSQHAETVCILLKLGRIAVSVLGANHLLACLWMLIGRSATAPNGRRWIDEIAWYEADGPVAYQDTDLFYQYMVTFHWAIAQITLGTSGIGAYNSIEELFTVICLLIGLLMGTTLISMFSAEMVEAQLSTRQQDMLTKQLRRFLQRQNIDGKLSRKVRAIVAHRMKKTAPLAESDIKSLQLLPLPIQMELHFEICGAALLTHPLFCTWYSFSMTSILRICKETVHLAYMRENDELFSAGGIAEKVYHLKAGSGSYAQEPESAPVVAAATTQVDPNQWLAEPALWMQWYHVGTFKVVEASEVLVVQAVDFAAGIAQHSVMQDIVLAYCHLYQQRVACAAPPRRKFPSDLSVPGTAFEDLLFSMDPSFQEAISAQAVHHLTTFAGTRSQSNELDRAYKLGSLVFLVSKDQGTTVYHRTTLRIERPTKDGGHQVLVHAGRLNAYDKLVVLGELPTKRQNRGEPAEAALSRILEERLSAVQKVVEGLPRHKTVHRRRDSVMIPNRHWSRSVSSTLSCPNVDVETCFKVQLSGGHCMLDRYVIESSLAEAVSDHISYPSYTVSFKKTISTLGGVVAQTPSTPGKYSSKASQRASFESKSSLRPSFRSARSRSSGAASASASFATSGRASASFAASFAASSTMSFSECVVMALKNAPAPQEFSFDDTLQYDLFLWCDEEQFADIQTGSGKEDLKRFLSKFKYEEIHGAESPTGELDTRLDQARQTANVMVSFGSIYEEVAGAETENEVVFETSDHQRPAATKVPQMEVQRRTSSPPHKGFGSDNLGPGPSSRTADSTKFSGVRYMQDV